MPSDQSYIPCKWAPRHLPTVVVARRLRDWFRRTYWVRCWECDFRRGPFSSVKEADNCRRHTEEMMFDAAS